MAGIITETNLLEAYLNQENKGNSSKELKKKKKIKNGTYNELSLKEIYTTNFSKFVLQNSLFE